MGVVNDYKIFGFDVGEVLSKCYLCLQKTNDPSLLDLCQGLCGAMERYILFLLNEGVFVYDFVLTFLH